jgi:hypothetical protein
MGGERLAIAALVVVIAGGCSDDRAGRASVDGGGSATPGFVRTISVTVDDETGRPCATKADGTYRCWTDSILLPLPADDYVRVQAARLGLIGLTRDGRLRAVSFAVPHDPPPAPVIELSVTNMYGYQAVCYRTSVDGPFTIFQDRESVREAGLTGDPYTDFPGPFDHALCAYEGLYGGVRPDGTAWGFGEGRAPAAGGNLRRLALSASLSCGLLRDGEISCVVGRLREDTPAPTFPPGPYTHLAVTTLVACALTAEGELRCLRADGKEMATPPGPYTDVSAGANVMCAIRADGTSGCWMHEASWLEPAVVTRFVPVVPAVEEGW